MMRQLLLLHPPFPTVWFMRSRMQRRDTLALALDMLKGENKLVACRSTNETVQGLDTYIVNNARLTIRMDYDCNKLDYCFQV